MGKHKMFYIGKNREMVLEKCHFCKKLNLIDCESCLLGMPQFDDDCSAYEAIAHDDVLKRLKHLLETVGDPIASDALG